MAQRGIRLVIVALLLSGGAIAGQRLHEIDRRADALAAAEADVTGRLTRIAITASGIGVAQQSYFAPEPADALWFERTSSLLRQFSDDTAAVRPLLRSVRAAEGLRSLSELSDALMAADNTARENLRLGHRLMAADLISSDTRATLDAMATTVSRLQAAEQEVHATERAAMVAERWTMLTAAGGVWTLGLLLLALLPGRADSRAVAAAVAPTGSTQPLAPVSAQPVHANVDLIAAADLCVALSRVTSMSSLPALLGRAAAILDSSGIIVWVDAGEELSAVAAHGYTPQVIARLGSIARSAQNATAAAWRAGRITVVAGNSDTSGAVVAPMFGPDGCLGVLSVELRQGRNPDAAVQSVASMIGAQLATAVAGWPVASPTSPPPRQPAQEFRPGGL